MTLDAFELLLRTIDEVGLLIVIILWIFGRYRNP